MTTVMARAAKAPTRVRVAMAVASAEAHAQLIAVLARNNAGVHGIVPTMRVTVVARIALSARVPWRAVSEGPTKIVTAALIVATIAYLAALTRAASVRPTKTVTAALIVATIAASAVGNCAVRPTASAPRALTTAATLISVRPEMAGWRLRLPTREVLELRALSVATRATSMLVATIASLVAPSRALSVRPTENTTRALSVRPRGTATRVLNVTLAATVRQPTTVVREPLAASAATPTMLCLKPSAWKSATLTA